MYVAFIIVIVKFYKMETIPLNIKCEFIPLLQRKKLHSALCTIFNRHFRVLLFGVLSVRVVGTCQRTERAVHNHNSCSKCPPTSEKNASQ
jgi:hypothetical protein